MKCVAWTVILVCAFAIPASAQGGVTVSLGLHPGGSVPLGADAAVYRSGPAGTLETDLALRSLPIARLTAAIGYGLYPVVFGTSLSVLSMGLGPGLTWDIVRWFGLQAESLIGFYYAFLNDGSGPRQGGFAAAGWAGLHINAGRFVTIELEGGYGWYAALGGGLGIRAGVMAHLAPGGAP